jgi:hypothetical protein
LPGLHLELTADAFKCSTVHLHATYDYEATGRKAGRPTRPVIDIFATTPQSQRAGPPTL